MYFFDRYAFQISDGVKVLNPKILLTFAPFFGIVKENKFTCSWPNIPNKHGRSHPLAKRGHAPPYNLGKKNFYTF